MYGDVEKTQCAHCDHLKVCSLKEQFLAAQKAVDKVTIGVGNNGIKYLRDFDWIKPVTLECIHYSIRKRTVNRTASDISP